MIAITPRLALYGGIVAAFVAMATFAGCEHHNAKAARADRADALGALAVALKANDTNQDTIGKLEAAIKHWRGTCTPETRIREAAEEAKTWRAKYEAEARRRREQRTESPSCTALMDTSFERVCAADARRLRKYADRDRDTNR
jgi:hypothetical protein